MTDLYEVIRTITEQRINDRKYPTYALEMDVKSLYTGDSFESEIATLTTVGLIRTGRTINQNYYQLTEL